MFEQATLNNGPAGKRAFTTLVGVTSQVALVSIAVLAPMLFPQVLPLRRLEISLAPPLPPAPRQMGTEVKQRPTHASTATRPDWHTVFVQPREVPQHETIFLRDEPTESRGPSGPVGKGDGIKDGVIGTEFLQGLMSANTHLLPVMAAPKPVEKAAPAPPEPIIRYAQGGNVKLGTVLRKVEPQYPPLARATRTQGDVALECVVGADGLIKDVKVKSGNPLLVSAAVEAAWKWAYGPSKLNGNPIEIVTIMTFSFKLN